MLLALMIMPLQAQDNVIDEVVWVVGDEAILKSEVEQVRIRAQYEGRKFDGDPYCVIPEELALQLPVAKELHLKKAAKTVGEKSIEMIPVSEINKLTGYIRGGCSPIGMKKLYTTTIDVSAEELERIFVSAGKIGMQLGINPKELAKLVNAKFGDITTEE